MLNEQSQTNNTKAKTGGNPSHIALYAKAAKYAPEVIDKLYDLMLNADNDNAKVAACKTLLSKSIPDLSATEITGKNGQSIELFINLGSGFVPASIRIPAPPAAGTSTGQPPLQSTGLAPQGA